MAEVWAAEAIFATGERHPVAIKRVLPELVHDPRFRSMFEDESRLGMLLRHPNIVRVHDAREVGGTFIMVMELVEGPSAKVLLDKGFARGRGLPVATALHLTRELARALAYAHTATDSSGEPLRIVHRDVSPHNFLLGRDGAAKLADFGLANASVQQTTGDGMVGGKLGYLAPEVLAGGATTPLVDVFAAGIMLWEMIAGRRLFQGKDDMETVRAVARLEAPSLHSIRPQVPKPIDDLARRVLEKDPSKRLESAQSLVDQLDDMIDWLDARVSEKDVALMVSLHLAQEPPPPPLGDTYANILEQELAAFVDESSGTVTDIGAEPLDPRLFR